MMLRKVGLLRNDMAASGAFAGGHSHQATTPRRQREE